MNYTQIVLSLMALLILINSVYSECEGDYCVPDNFELPEDYNYSTGTLPNFTGGNLSNSSTGIGNSSGLAPIILGLAKETLIKIACIILILSPLITIRPPNFGIGFSVLITDFIVLLLPNYLSITNDLFILINFLGIIAFVGGRK